MFQINENYQKLPGSYLFSTIAKKVAAYSSANPDKSIIRLGIGVGVGSSACVVSTVISDFNSFLLPSS